MSKEALNDQDLVNVNGGTQESSLDPDRQAEFESAWLRAGLNKKTISDMRKAVLFDEWEMANFTPDAYTYLSMIDLG
ncbi:MAG: hypothetical protein K6G10_10370 [Butyrivibrio sp.]|nr:hypothetical protein [Butyrivibrio sp.]